VKHAPVLIAAVHASLLLAGCSSEYSYSAKVIGYTPVDPAHLSVAVQVTNTGPNAGTPSCLIQGISTQTGDNGTTDVTLEGTLQPGQSTHFATSMVITSQGASTVNHVTVSCTE